MVLGGGRCPIDVQRARGGGTTDIWGEQGSLVGLGLTGVGHWGRPSTTTTLILSPLYTRKSNGNSTENNLSTI